jgi:hypothetical protein
MLAAWQDSAQVASIPKHRQPRAISARYRANSPTLLFSVMIADLAFPFWRVHLSVRHSGICV